LNFWESEKENLFQVSCHWGIIRVFGVLFSVGKNTIQCIVRESGKAICKELQMSSTCEKCLIAKEAWRGSTAATKSHQTPDLCILVTKAMN
jgi:hypothetical protein